MGVRAPVGKTGELRARSTGNLVRDSDISWINSGTQVLPSYCGLITKATMTGTEKSADTTVVPVPTSTVYRTGAMMCVAELALGVNVVE